jgi:hypothetical protein
MQLNVRHIKSSLSLTMSRDDIIIIINHLHQSSGAELRARSTGGLPLPLGGRRSR